MTEEEAIKLIRSGGKAMDAGVKALYLGMGKQMLRFFVYRGLSGDLAKDVLQDTMVNIVRNATAFSGEGTAKSWVWQIARNCLANHFRKQHAGEGGNVPDGGWPPREPRGYVSGKFVKSGENPAGNGGSPREPIAPEPELNRIAVDECVSLGIDAFGDQMPDRAYALTLQMDGLGIAEIGECIGRSTAATKEYLSQCRKKLEPFVVHCMDLLRA